MNPEQYVIGVDVGTGSARAGIFDRAGNMLANANHDIIELSVTNDNH